MLLHLFSTSNNFVTTLNNPINVKKDTRVAIESVSCWHSYHNVSAAIGNNIFRYNNGVSYNQLTIPDGNYSFDNLISLFNAFISSNGDDPNNLVISRNNNTAFVTVTVAASYTWDIQGLYVIFGFPQAEITVTSTGTTRAQITQVEEVLVHCDLVEGRSVVNSTRSDVLFSFTVSEAPNARIYREHNFNVGVDVTKQLVRDIRIRLTDQNNNLLNFNGEPISLTMYLF